MSNWITLSQNSGTSGTTIITVTADENTTLSQRTGTYKVSNNIDRAISVNIVQPAGLPFFTAYINVVDISGSVLICSGAFYVTHYRVDDGGWVVNPSYRTYNAKINYTFSTTGIHKVEFRTDEIANEGNPGEGTYKVPQRIFDTMSVWAGNPAGVTSAIIYSFYGVIGAYAFQYNKELTAVTLNSGLIYIDNAAFYGDDALTEISFPDTLTALAPLAFYRCSNLSLIYSYATTAPTIEPAEYGYHAFRDISPTGILHYPSGSDYSSWLSVLGSGWTGVADL